MSAIVIPFKLRTDDATAVAVPAETTAEVIKFPPRPYSLSTSDVAALQALAPMLDGAWTYKTLVNDSSDTWAIFEDHDVSLVFFVCRSGKRLRLFNEEGELVDSYASVDALTAILKDALARRTSLLINGAAPFVN